MDPYDSDSSGFEDDGDYTETGVLLGYPSEELIDDSISHLGGWPTWLDDATPPPGDFANCKVCNSPMALLLELHGDLPEHFPDDERRLYIFSCPRKPCNRKPGSVRALRATRKVKSQPAAPRKEEPQPANEPPKQDSTPKPDLGASLFGANTLTGSVSANSNPFSSSSSPAASSNNPFAAPAPAAPHTTQPASSTASANALAESFADKVRVSAPSSASSATVSPPESSGPHEPWPAQSAFPDAYKQFYLDAEYETLSRPSTPTVPENVTIDNTEDDAGASGGAELKDALESQLDKAFIKFSTRLAHNPEQILRYEFRGTPLLYSHNDAVGKRFHDANKAPAARVTTVKSAAASNMPRCEYCGSERVFELQLVPHAISVLEEGREGMDAGMEWGTIILGVCNKDCGPQEAGVTGWREEWAGVQWEEAQ
ncbi:PDCD2_C domain protein [Aspergillus ambiguus]|uniref:small subunit rRNA maturation protein TSR4 n=1 Tax=Aspergillus ambiguus TaxID=176160 RepID=UPI003CCDB028